MEEALTEVEHGDPASFKGGEAETGEGARGANKSAQFEETLEGKYVTEGGGGGRGYTVTTTLADRYRRECLTSST